MMTNQTSSNSGDVVTDKLALLPGGRLSEVSTIANDSQQPDALADTEAFDLSDCL